MTNPRPDHAQDCLPAWHRVVASGSSSEDLAAIIGDECVFHSPVVHTPQAGKAKVISYLSAAGQTFSNTGFRYVREICDGPYAMLEFTANLDGIHLNGIDLITFGDDGLITDFKVMVRPLKAVNATWQRMAAELEKQAG